MNHSKVELANIFKALGANNSQVRAFSQIEEGIPQLHRFVFLKQIWAQVVDEDDISWIEQAVKFSKDNPDSPFAGQGQAMERMLACGVQHKDILDLARNSQAEIISSLCYLLEDPSLDANTEEVVGSLGWALVTTDEDFEPTSEIIGGLHESVLETDPTGREMRPRDRTDD